jgi:hypothetical protein
MGIDRVHRAGESAVDDRVEDAAADATGIA